MLPNPGSGAKSGGHANVSKCADTGYGAMIGGASPDFVRGSASAFRDRTRSRILGPADTRRRRLDREDAPGSPLVGHPRNAAPLGGRDV